jgi:hypothetical protein
VSSVNTFGFKNRFINGGLSIDQRNAGASQTITAAAALAYTVDRWYAYCTGANVTGQQIAGTYLSSQYRYQFTGAASVTTIGFGQRIEQANSYDLANTTATLSCYISNSLLTTVTWTAYYANTANTFGSLASPTVTQIATGTFTVTSTRTQYSTQIAIPSAATTGIQIVFTVGAQTSGTWVIDTIQLEEGTQATSFDYRPYGTELVLCQRYYYKIKATAASFPFGMGQCYSTTIAGFLITYPTTMRIAPTALEQSGTATDYQIYGAAGVIITCNSVPAMSGILTTAAYGTVNAGVAAGIVAGSATTLASATSTAYLGWSAEL